MNKATICIIGDGAIGSLVAASASQSGMVVYRAIRGSSPAVGLVIGVNQRSTRLPDTIIRTGSDAPAFDLIIVPLKVYQLENALRDWLPLFGNAPVMLLQNGMGGDEIAAPCLRGQRLYQATTSHGALKESPGTVRHTGAGQTTAGRARHTPVNQTFDTRVRQLTERAFSPLTWSENIHLTLWQKLSVNLVINPLTAIHNMRNGELLDTRFDVVRHQLCMETASVMQACGVEETAETVLTRVRTVAAATAANYSSMHQDVTHNRPTEIDAITGYLIALADSKGVSVPHHKRLYEQLRALSPHQPNC